MGVTMRPLSPSSSVLVIAGLMRYCGPLIYCYSALVRHMLHLLVAVALPSLCYIQGCVRRHVMYVPLCVVQKLFCGIATRLH